jgi:hypothetical protein
MKAGVQCVYAVPARPRRRIGNGKSAEDVSREELIHRVRRYEALFRTHGIHLDVPKHQSDGGGNSNLASHNITNAALLHDQGPQQSQDDDVQSGLARQ